MTYFISDLDTIVRLASLLDDLARIAAGEGPTRADLAAAPLIDDWRLAARPQACLVGRIKAHPMLGDPPNGMTSMLFGIDEDGGWARTLSRWYRLGNPAPDSNPWSEQ